MLHIHFIVEVHLITGAYLTSMKNELEKLVSLEALA